MNKLTITTLIIAVCLSSNAMAKKHAHYDRAKVIDVTPVYERVKHKVPVRDCEHSDRHHYKKERRNSALPTIAGGIVGGVIGHSVGNKKSDKNLGLVAGTLIGATIGSNIKVDKHHGGYDRSCSERYRVKYKRVLTGYDVAYKYQGHVYHTHTKHHPGKRIDVKVRVEPVHGNRNKGNHNKGRHDKGRHDKGRH